MAVSNEFRCVLNRRCCRQLIQVMAKNGWEAYELDAGEFPLNGKNLRQKVEEVFDVDGATICFRKNEKIHGVLFIPDNTGIECVADWSFSAAKNGQPEDADGFGAIMDKFTDDPKWDIYN